jgi:hypothetical protein
MTTSYVVRKSAAAASAGCAWDAPAWRAAQTLRLDRYMGGEPAHRPVVEARLLWDEESLHVIFRVRDRWVRAVVSEPQGPVCTDSCVELFFSPQADAAGGYFNVEVSCGGTTLFQHQLGRGRSCRRMTDADVASLAVEHTLPARVEPEIQEPTEWLVRYRVPYATIAAWTPVARPAAGAVWRANLYKCADDTSHPHWLTWAPVDRPEPDFHRPEFFGTLLFADEEGSRG